MASNEYGYIGEHADVSSYKKSGVFNINDQKVLDDDLKWSSNGVLEGRVFYIDAANPFSYSGSGNSVTEIDNNVTGTNTGTQTLSSADGGGSFYFNGTGGLEFSDITALNTANKTIIMWVKAAPNHNGFIFEKGTVNTQYSFFFSGVNSYFRDYDHASTGDLSTNISTHLSASAYTQFIAWHSGTSKRLYKNGSTLLNSMNTGLGNGVTNSNGIRVGEYNGNSYYLNGNVGLIKVFNRGLTTDEMDLEFNTYKTRFGL